MIIADYGVLSFVRNDGGIDDHLRLRQVTLLKYFNPERALFGMSICLHSEAEGVLGPQTLIIVLI